MNNNPLLKWRLVAFETIDEARVEGLDFGFAALGVIREDFEWGLNEYLERLSEHLTNHCDKHAIVAAFDMAAWDAWEIGKE